MIVLSTSVFFSGGTRAQHLTLCVWWWCPLDGCDAPIGQRGKTTVQSQSVCTHNRGHPIEMNRAGILA